jgi:O-antigen ligase/tetratricopeptide (TPR) repeat protein
VTLFILKHPAAYYFPNLIWVGMGLCALYAFYELVRVLFLKKDFDDFAEDGGLELDPTRARRKRYLRLCLAVFVLALLSLVLHYWGARFDIHFWRNKQYLETSKVYEKIRDIVALALSLVVFFSGCWLFIRRRGVEAFCRLGIRLLFLSLFPTTFWFRDTYMATGVLVYKEVVSIIIIGMIFMLWVLRTFHSGRLRLLDGPYNLPVLLLWVVAAISLLWVEPIYGSSKNFIYLTCYLALYLMIAPEMTGRHMVRLFVVVILLVATVVAAGSFCQLSGYYWGELLYRPMGNVRADLGSTIGHNNPVAHLMMVSMILVIGLAFNAKRHFWSRLLWLLPMIMLFAIIIIALQTRGVWVALPVALVAFFFLYNLVFVWKRGKQARFRMLGRWAFGIVSAAVILVSLVVLLDHVTQQGPAQNKLTERIQQFHPSILMKGTRFRLYRLSLHMIRDQLAFKPISGQPPLMGMGLSAWKWHYPDYQARYFKKYPNSQLLPTHLHTDRAHNEYLQPVAELGFLGAIFVIWFILAHFRFLYMIWKAPTTRRLRLWQITFACALLASMIHCMVNFTFHTAPLALLFLSNFMILSSLGPVRVRTWRFCSLKENPLLSCVCIAIGIFVFSLLADYCGRILNAELKLNWGNKYFGIAANLAAQGSPAEKGNAGAFIDESERYFSEGLALTPRMAKLNEAMARCCVTRFRLDQNSGRRPRPDLLLKAKRHYDMVLSELKHKSLYMKQGVLLMQLGQLAREMRLTPMPGVTEADVSYLQSQVWPDAQKDFETASDIFPIEFSTNPSPNDILPLHSLGKLLYTRGKENEAFAVWKRIYGRQPNYVREFHLRQGDAYQKAGETGPAGFSYRIAHTLAPDDEQTWISFIRFYLNNGLRDKAVDLTRQYIDAFPNSTRALKEALNTSALVGKPGVLFDEAFRYLVANPVNEDNCNTLLAYAANLRRLQDATLSRKWMLTMDEKELTPERRRDLFNVIMTTGAHRQNWAEGLDNQDLLLQRHPECIEAQHLSFCSLAALLAPVMSASNVKPQPSQ